MKRKAAIVFVFLILSLSLLFGENSRFSNKSLSLDISSPIMVGKSEDFETTTFSLVVELKNELRINKNFAINVKGGISLPLLFEDSLKNRTDFSFGMGISFKTEINPFLSFITSVDGDIFQNSKILEENVIGTLFFFSLDTSALLRFSLGEKRNFFISLGLGAKLPLISKMIFSEETFLNRRMFRSDNMNGFYALFLYPEFSIGVEF